MCVHLTEGCRATDALQVVLYQSQGRCIAVCWALPECSDYVLHEKAAFVFMSATRLLVDQRVGVVVAGAL